MIARSLTGSQGKSRNIETHPFPEPRRQLDIVFQAKSQRVFAAVQVSKSHVIPRRTVPAMMTVVRKMEVLTYRLVLMGYDQTYIELDCF